jgi:hypothetical protein
LVVFTDANTGTAGSFENGLGVYIEPCAAFPAGAAGREEISALREVLTDKGSTYQLISIYWNLSPLIGAY